MWNPKEISKSNIVINFHSVNFIPRLLAEKNTLKICQLIQDNKFSVLVGKGG